METQTNQTPDQISDLPPNIGTGDVSSNGPELPSFSYEPPADTPPESKQRRGRPRKETADERIHGMLMQVYGGAGMLAFMVNQYDGSVIAAKAKDCSDGWLAVAHRHPEIYRALDIMSRSNAYILLGTAHLGIFVAIAVNHDLIPRTWGERLGVQAPPKAPPDVINMGPQQERQAPTPAPAFSTQLTPEQMEQVRAMAVAQAQAQQAAGASFNPTDTIPRPEQNPALVAGLIDRR